MFLDAEFAEEGLMQDEQIEIMPFWHPALAVTLFTVFLIVFFPLSLLWCIFHGWDESFLLCKEFVRDTRGIVIILFLALLSVITFLVLLFGLAFLIVL